MYERNAIEKLASGKKILLRELLALSRIAEELEAKLLIPLAKQALEMGENFLAYDIAEKIDASEGQTFLTKTHIMILALARSGSLKRASELLATLPEVDDSEIIGLKSRLLKDMALAESEPSQRAQYFRQAGEMSLHIFRLKQRYYNGINAATCLFMGGEVAQAQALVRDEVLPLCRLEDPQDMWLQATLGECAMLLGDYAAATEHYNRFLALAPGQYGTLSSTLRQLKMIADALDEAAQAVLKALKLPAIAIFSGHMIDTPSRPTPRFPAAAEDQVRQALAAIIRRDNIKLSYSSCACGGDILFIEEVLAAGGECFVIPPLPLAATITNSVDIVPEGDWTARLKKILSSDHVFLLESECDEIGDPDADAIVYHFANLYIFGQALLKSKALNLPLYGVTVWDGCQSGKTGGTDSAVALWQEYGLTPIEIVTPEIRRD